MRTFIGKLSSVASFLKRRGILNQCWYGICAPWGNSFSTLGGTFAKFQLVVNGASGVAAFIAVGMLVYGGYTFITGAGDADKIEQANKMITNAIIGLVIVFIARLIILFVLDSVIN